jgi:subtilase-type serine protease
MNGGSLTINSVPTQGMGSVVQAGGFATINGGLVENNSFFVTPSFNIGPAGTVSGTGVFTNSPGIVHLTNAGTLKPGSPTGTMTIQGNYIQTPTGNFVASFASPSSFSQLNVSGTAQLAGTLTTILLPGGTVSSQKYPILNAGGGVSGQFNNVVSNFGLEPNVEYLLILS